LIALEDPIRMYLDVYHLQICEAAV
jgi:hypothetical protein